MKMFLGLVLVTAIFVMAACESTVAQPATGKTEPGMIGNTGVKVSGAVETGGTVSNR